MSCRPLDVESFRNRARLPKGITRRKRGGYDESKKVSRTLLTADLDPGQTGRPQRGSPRPPGDDDPREPKRAVPFLGRDHDVRCEPQPGGADRLVSQATATQVGESGSPFRSPEA